MHVFRHYSCAFAHYWCVFRRYLYAFVYSAHALETAHVFSNTTCARLHTAAAASMYTSCTAHGGTWLLGSQFTCFMCRPCNDTLVAVVTTDKTVSYFLWHLRVQACLGLIHLCFCDIKLSAPELYKLSIGCTKGLRNQALHFYLKSALEVTPAHHCRTADID